ncbi:hypothetical protein Scep_015289 [Stephania cephalantha]|uniref:Uncharacterized protein n=1 Tax=Stephania cephalantha TaxID=152367 RepID=A0AAP0P189_9MAGN
MDNNSKDSYHHKAVNNNRAITKISKQQQPMERNEIMHKSLAGLLTSRNREPQNISLASRFAHPTPDS